MRQWVRWLIGLTLGAALIVAYPLSEASAHARNSALVGWGVSLAVSGSSGFLAFWSLGRSQRMFLLVTFGGMLVRLSVVSIAVAVAVLFLGVHIPSFLMGLLGAYTVYLALELVMLNRCRAQRLRGAADRAAAGSQGVAA